MIQNEKKKDILEALSRHLTKGRLDEEARKDLAFIESEVKPSLEFGGGDLYRGLMLPVGSFEKLRDGDTLRAEGVRHECWSREVNPVMKMLRTRSEQDPEHIAVILKRTVCPGEIAFDVVALMNELGAYRPDFPGFRYASQEAEVILRKPEMSFDDVMGFWGPDDRLDLFTPRAGEPFWDYEMDKETHIEEFLGHNEETGFPVIMVRGEPVEVLWEYGEWMRSGFPSSEIRLPAREEELSPI